MFASTSTSGHTDLFLHIKEKQDGTGDSGKVGTLLNQTGVTKSWARLCGHQFTLYPLREAFSLGPSKGRLTVYKARLDMHLIFMTTLGTTSSIIPFTDGTPETDVQGSHPKSNFLELV